MSDKELASSVVRYLHGLLQREEDNYDEAFVPEPFAGLPVEVLIACTEDEYVFASLVSNWNYSNPMPEAVRTKILTASESVRCQYAHKSQYEPVPPDVWDLVGDTYPSVRRALVGIQTPVDILVKLATDPDEEVRKDVARYSSKLPKECVLKLSSDLSKEVRKEVAYRCGDDELILELLDDDEAIVRQHAISGLGRTGSGSISLDQKISEAFDKHIHDIDEDVRANIARTVWASPSAWDVLSRDVSNKVRLGVAYNKKTPVEVLTRLSKDADLHIASRAAMTLGLIPEGCIGNQGRPLT